MKGYGLPRNNDVDGPDKLDIAVYGLNGFKESAGFSARKRKAARRVWKKKFRQSCKRKLLGAERRYDGQVQ